SIKPLHLWRGVFQSVRPTFDRIVVNVDTTVGVVVPESSLVRLCQEYLREPNLEHITSAQFQQLRLFLRGIKITVNHPGRREPRTLKIRDLVLSVGEEVFEKVVHQQIGNREQHFRESYNLPIPPGSLGIRGTQELFPITFCRTVQQLYRNKLPPEKSAKVLKFGLKTPKAKLEDINREWAALNHRESEFLRGGGITFSASSTPLEVDGRRLSPPKIQYGSSQYHPGGQIEKLETLGSWNMLDKTFKKPATINSWVIVDFTHRSNSTKLTQFLQKLYHAMQTLGSLWVKPPKQRAGVGYAVEQVLEQACLDYQPDLLVVILNEFDADLYTRVKRFGDITFGVPTQCIVSFRKWTKRLSESSPSHMSQYHNNLLLKRAHSTDMAMRHLASQATMILGADVSHPGPQSTLPSVAGLVSSWDMQACKYGAFVRLQRSRLEIIEDLEEMVLSALELFFRKQNSIPRIIYYFRDGVSEGQFDAVFDFEYSAIKNAINNFKLKKYPRLPEIAFIICSKRHHTRFFPRDHPSTDFGGKGNCWPGLVVDSGSRFSHPHYVDFYLQSQKGLQGTSRPTHFTILSDPRPPMDLLQSLTYTLCHCYSRATKSVKIPAPVYYADLVCSRAKFHYDDHVDYFDDISVNSDSPEYNSKQLKFYKEHFHPVHQNLRDTMYFV
ncbi:Piwi domain-containing protein, partial [Mycena leptocephala]